MMRSGFYELKRFAIADILSVSGKQKATETINMHINTIIDIAFLKGQQASQSKIDELQKQVTDLDNRATKYALDAMATAKLNAELQKRVDAVKALIEEYRDPPTEDKTFCHALSIVAYELEQALKGGSNG